MSCEALSLKFYRSRAFSKFLRPPANSPQVSDSVSKMAPPTPAATYPRPCAEVERLSLCRETDLAGTVEAANYPEGSSTFTPLRHMRCNVEIAIVEMEIPLTSGVNHALEHSNAIG